MTPNHQRKPLHRILLKFTNQAAKPTKQQIFETSFRDLLAPLTKLTDTKTGFYATTDDQNAIDKLTSAKAIQSFNKINIIPVEPPELRSKKTIFVRQVDSIAGENTAEEIKEELQRNHSWLKIQEIVKIKTYTHVFKIICTETAMASKILENGVCLFNTKIPPFNCEQEEYTHLMICYKCYQVEDHPTINCRSTTIICSECGQTGHTWTECKTTTKKCVNCTTNDDHRTLAAKCPYRRKKIEEKKNKEKENHQQKENATYAKIVQETVHQTNKSAQPTQNLHLNSSLQTKITILVIEAHIASLAGKEKYGDILTKSIKLNYGINISFPERNSAEIFKIHMDPKLNQPEPKRTRHDTMTSIASTATSEAFMDDDDIRSSLLNLSAQHRTPIKNRYELLSQMSLPELDNDNENNDTDFEFPQAIKAKSNERKRKQKRKPALFEASSTENIHIEAMEHSTTSNKRKISEEASQIAEEQGTSEAPQNYKIAICKSRNDPEPLPQKRNVEYLMTQFGREDEYGLRFFVEEGDLATAFKLLSEGKITISEDYPITYLDHADFICMKRIPPLQHRKKPKPNV